MFFDTEKESTVLHVLTEEQLMQVAGGCSPHPGSWGHDGCGGGWGHDGCGDGGWGRRRWGRWGCGDGGWGHIGFGWGHDGCGC